MSRKHFEAIAAAVRGQLDQTANPFIACGIAETARAIADVCAADNPRFDRERFLRACGVSS